MPIQSLANFDDGPNGIGSSVCSKMESSRSTRAMKRRNLISQRTLQESFLIPAEGAVTFDCMFCNESYKHHGELGKHVLRKHRPTLCEPTVLRIEAEFLSPQDKRRKSAGSPVEDVEDENEGSDCEVCGQTFADSSDLECHMKKHKQSFMYSCNICGRRFKEPWFLKNHKKIHSSRAGGKNKHLPVPQTPATINEVVQEQVTESFNSPYKLCMVCGFYFPDKKTLLDHSKMHINGSNLAGKSTGTASSKENVNGKDGVQMPKEAFLSFLNLKPVSAADKKPETARKWIGELDPFNTYQSWQLATKGKLAFSHGQEKEPFFEANVETDSSSDKDEVTDFWNTIKLTQLAYVKELETVMSEDGERGAVKRNADDLKIAAVGVPCAKAETKPPNDREKSTFCIDCGKLFKTYHQLVLHSRVHRKDRSDSESSASFDGLVATNSPNTSADPKEGSKMEQGGGNSAPTAKNVHKRSAVRKKGLPISTQCSYCKKSFRSNYYLNIHCRTHTGEKPYECEFCDYNAAQKTSLRYHLERHHWFRPGDSNARVITIGQKVQLKLSKPPAATVQLEENHRSQPPINDDKEDPLMAKPPKRMSALRNTLVNAKRGQKNQSTARGKKEAVKGKRRAARKAAPCQPPKTPPPPLDGGEEISLACAETLDDDPCFMEEGTSTDQSNGLRVDPVVEDDPAPMDLCTKSAKNVSTKSYKRALLAMPTCPYCTYKTLYPEVLSMHQRLAHKQNYEPLHKAGVRGKNPGLVLKMRRTGCPPVLKGVDVPPLQLEIPRPKGRPASQTKVNEKPKRAPAQANKAVNPPSGAQVNKPHPTQVNKPHPTQVNKPHPTQVNKPHPAQENEPHPTQENEPHPAQENKPQTVQQNGQQVRNYRHMQPDLQGITHLLERMPQPEQRNPQCNPSTSQKSNTMAATELPYPIVPMWSGEHPFNRPGMSHRELGEPFTKRVKHNMSNSIATQYLNPEVARRLQSGQVSVNGPEMAPGKLINPPLPNKQSHPYELDPRDVMKFYEHAAAGPLYRIPNTPLAQGSTSAMEGKHTPLYQRIAKRDFGPNEKTT